MQNALMLAMVLLACGVSRGEKKAVSLRFLPIGVFIASIEEGARIFTPVRLLPFEHPESFGHQFPNALQLRGTEFDTLVFLGELAGLRLSATLQRYPAQPDATWPYQGFAQPPLRTLRKATVVRRPTGKAPVPGLRAVAYYRGAPVAFIVDTRGLSLAERRMERPTTMGLDMSRADFLNSLTQEISGNPKEETAIVIYKARPCAGNAV